MASEEWAKRFLRLAAYSPKDTREPRGPEHMAKMKAARGPYSDPRDTYMMREIRWAFKSSNGRPLSTGYLVEKVFGWQLRLNGKPKKSWHYQNVRRALRKVATPIGRASTRGRSVLWQPDERMGLGGRGRQKKQRATTNRWTIKRTVGWPEEMEMAAAAQLTLVAPGNEKFTVRSAPARSPK